MYLKHLEREYILLFIIVLFGLILRIAFFSGMGISDSLAYSEAANSINTGKGINTESALTLSTRIGLIYATALSYRIFGVNDFSAVFFVLLTSLGTIVLAYFFGRLLFNKRVGLMAAFLLSFFPLDVVYSTKLLSDVPSAFFMALGVYFFLYAEKFPQQKRCYFLAGIFIGIGYLIRESVLLIGLFFAIYVIYKKKLKKEYIVVALGFLAVFAIEMAAFYALTGDALYRLSASQKFLADAVAKHNYFGRLSFPTGLLHYPYIILTSGTISYFYISIFIAIIYCWARGKKETYILQFWFISLLLYLSFGSASISRYIPFRAVDRYLTIITIPGILLLAFFLMEKRIRTKKMTMAVILAILIVTSIISAYVYGGRDLQKGLKEAKPYIEDLDKVIFIDKRSIKVLNFLSEYKSDMDLRQYPKNLSNIKNSYIVINKEMIRNVKDANKYMKFPPEIEDPPKHWVKMREIGEEDKDKIIIYYVG
jgi:4-amino-4-deoxy-L-arabinose transferase-like glycosyltransferase